VGQSRQGNSPKKKMLIYNYIWCYLIGVYRLHQGRKLAKKLLPNLQKGREQPFLSCVFLLIGYLFSKRGRAKVAKE
jgi:hypothetical protein